MKRTNLLLGIAGAIACSPLFAQFTVLENFEALNLGTQPANFAGNFTIVDGVGTIGSGKAAQITAASMQHRFTWGGDAQPVITVSFDMYNGSAITEAQPLRFAFNLNSGGLMTGGNNIVRLAMRQDGTFDFEATLAASEVYTDATYPLDTPMTLHLVFNSSNAPVTYSGGGTLAANSIELWKEIGGVLSHVGYSPFDASKVDGALDSMGFATNSTYGSAGDFIVDNLRWADGVAVVPEPGTYAVALGLISLAVLLLRRRRP